MTAPQENPAKPGLPPAPERAGSLWRRFFPGLNMLFRHEPGAWRQDIVAAVTLAAYLLPAGMGDASLAGLPPEAGLYACLFGGLVFWLFCSSRHTSVTVTSAISLLIGASLGELAGGDAARYWTLAAWAAVLTAGLAFAAWCLRAGVLVNFISETVMIGFKTGVALHLISTQLPKLFGFSGSHGDFWERIAYFFSHIGETEPVALAVGAGALVALLAGKVWLKNRPVALFVMVAAIALAAATQMGEHGVKLLGRMPQGLPPVGLSPISMADLHSLFPIAMACFMLGAVETAAIGRTFALKHGYKIDTNQELLALAAANLAASVGHGYPVSGGMSQSLVNESAGARTPLTGLLASLLILLIVVFVSGILRNLPQPVLAAIVLSAVTGLIKVRELKRLWHFDRWEFAVSAVAVMGVLTAGLLYGVLIGAVLTIVVLLRRASRPRAGELGRVPNTQYFADMDRHPENERLPEVFVFRADTSLLYFNVDFVHERFMHLLEMRTDKPRLAVFHLGTVPRVDLAGAELLMELHNVLRRRGIAFRLAEAHGNVRDALRRAGFEQAYGRVEANQTVHEVISRIEVALNIDRQQPAPNQAHEESPGDRYFPT
jgi:high affinity sulfate transporter 1